MLPRRLRPCVLLLASLMVFASEESSGEDDMSRRGAAFFDGLMRCLAQAI